MAEPPLFATLQVRRISVVLMAVATSVGTPGTSVVSGLADFVRRPTTGAFSG